MSLPCSALRATGNPPAADMSCRGARLPTAALLPLLALALCLSPAAAAPAPCPVGSVATGATCTPW